MPDYSANRLIIRLRGFDAQHYARTTRYARQVERLYNSACDEIAAAAGRITIPEDGVFSFDDFPATKKQAQGILTRLTRKVEAVITTGTQTEWEAACDKSDTFLNSILRTSRLSKEEAEQYEARNLEALQAFQQRKAGGLGLSQRVWKYTEEFKTAMELGIDVAVGEGRSAQQLSRDLRQYLQAPDKLFRRVRDKGGNLRLSKAAAMYHPGRGVYRSSAKNAERLARTEINMAYREAEYLRWQQLDFVVGFRVMLSNNHTIKNSKGEDEPLTDICDELAGDYPKSFKFLGWHPQCRCLVVPIMSDYDEYNKDRAGRLKAIVRGQTYKSLPSRRTVRDVPAAFRDHIAAIADRAKGWKSMPYYIRDNFKNGTISGGLLPTIPQKAQMPGTTAKPPEPCTAYDTRIATLKNWAYALGLNVSQLDPLRTAGQAAPLEAEIERLEELLTDRRREWMAALSELVKVKSQAAKFPDIVKECDDVLAANDRNPKLYYADCISRVKSAVTRLLAKLTTKKASSPYSEKMPSELENGGVYLGDTDHEYSKEFFDLLNETPTLEIRHTNKGSYESRNGRLVVLDSEDRGKASPWQKVKVVYHEFGHAIADQRKLLFAPEVTAVRDKQLARLRTREKAVWTTTERVYNYDKHKYEDVKVKHEKNQMRIVTLSSKLDNIYRKLKAKKADDAIFKRYGITKADAIEQFISVMDTLRSLVNRDDVGFGHTVSYFKGYGMQQHEYLAHAFENAFIGNRVFQLLMPTEYAEMVALVKTFKAP